MRYIIRIWRINGSVGQEAEVESSSGVVSFLSGGSVIVVKRGGCREK
jgi:hypothetical protein